MSGRAPGFYYLATSYSKHPQGLDAAYRMAVHATGVLLRAGVPVFSPIAHTHPIATICEMDPLDVDMWLRADEPMMDAARGIIVLRDGEWWASRGMAFEIARFKEAGKPVILMNPGEVPGELRP